MKTNLLLSILLILTHSFKSQKSFDVAYAPIKKELTNWDPVRGYWLGENLSNMVNAKEITDRAFPEDFTPYEMLKVIPESTYDKIRGIVDSEKNNLSGRDQSQWNQLNHIISNIACTYQRGRSYGDPHLISFDESRTSFQTVGEFSLTQSASNHMEVQARQKASGTDFSLNSAVAMNVFGDRLCIYASDRPDSDISALRLNGEPISLDGRTYYLPHGGNIRLAGRNYIINWPSGESVTVGMRRNFMNITVYIFNCSEQFNGLLGNADGNRFNDFQSQNGSLRRPANFFSASNINQSNVNAHREYLAFTSQNLAEDWRVDDQTTLFDYPMGMSTASFTDRSFPRIHHTIHDLSPQQLSNARTHCRENGINENDMAGCIYDQGFLNIPANPTPPAVDFTEDESLTPIRRPALNNNEHEYQEGKNPTGTAAVPIAPPNSSGNNPAHTTEKKPSKEINSSSKGNDNFWGNSSTNSTINKTPSNSSKPIFSRPSKTFNQNTPSRGNSRVISPSRTTPNRSSSPNRSTPSRSSSPSKSKGGKN